MVDLLSLHAFILLHQLLLHVSHLLSESLRCDLSFLCSSNTMLLDSGLVLVLHFSYLVLQGVRVLLLACQAFPQRFKVSMRGTQLSVLLLND